MGKMLALFLVFHGPMTSSPAKAMSDQISSQPPLYPLDFSSAPKAEHGYVHVLQTHLRQ